MTSCLSDEKVCSKCGLIKPLVEFKKDKRRPDGVGSQCKKCSVLYTKQYVLKHRGEVAAKQREYYYNNIDKIREYKRQYATLHKRQIAKRETKWRGDNKDSIREYQKDYYRKNKDKIIKRSLTYVANRRKIDSVFRNKARVRARIRKLIKSRGGSMTKRTQDILGCDYETLWKYLLFTWKNNYGKPWNGESYHIDHVEPLALAKTPKEVESLCHYSNLQMLTPEDNLKKGDKY